MRTLSRIFLFLVLTFSFVTSVHALNAQSLRYYFVSSRGINIIESKPKPKDNITFGFGVNYAYRPLEIGTATGSRVSGVVDHLVTFDLLGNYSFSDRAAVGINIPLHLTRNLVAIGGAPMETKFNIGDILISGLFNIIDPASNSINAGLAVTPFATLPSGRNSDFVGESSVTGGLMAIGDIDLDGHYIAANLGFRFRETEGFLNLSVASEFLYAVAYHTTISREIKLDVFAEISGSTVMKKFWQNINGSPLELKGGVSKYLLADDELRITGGLGVGIISGFSTPDVRGLLKITYNYPIHRTPVDRVDKVQKELNELTIYYPTDGSQVDPFYDQKIAEIAKILRKNPDLGPLYIVGSTDNVGSQRYNQRLSERRAKQAYKSIVSFGLNPNMIVYVGLGE
ncbi:hypothetical protein BVY03_00780, partial [bacterium K02(2017)]